VAPALSLAGINRTGAIAAENRVIDQVIVEDHVRRPEYPVGFDRHQLRIAGTETHQPNAPVIAPPV
jgi:hypothetical protein